MRKHNKSTKSLVLSTQTVRALADAELDGVAGGVTAFTCAYTCGCPPRTARACQQ